MSAAAAEIGGATNSSLNAYDDLGTLQAALTVAQQSRGAGQIFAAVPGIPGRLIVDSNGNSNFLQLLSQADLQLAIGQANMTWPGGSVVSNLLTIPHGLGRPPQGVAQLSQSVTGDADSVLVSANSAPDATNIYLRGRTITAFTPAASATNTLYWIAIG